MRLKTLYQPYVLKFRLRMLAKKVNPCYDVHMNGMISFLEIANLRFLDVIAFYNIKKIRRFNITIYNKKK